MRGREEQEDIEKEESEQRTAPPLPLKKMRKDERKLNDLAEDSPFKAKGYTVVKQWSFQDSKFKRVARPDIYRSSMVRLQVFFLFF